MINNMLNLNCQNNPSLSSTLTLYYLTTKAYAQIQIIIIDYLPLKIEKYLFSIDKFNSYLSFKL